MKFVKAGKFDHYRFYQNPFIVWLFKYDDRVEIAAHFGDHTLAHEEPDMESAMRWSRRWVEDQIHEFRDNLRRGEDEVIDLYKA